MLIRTLVVVVAVKGTVRLTRLLPVTEPWVTQAEPLHVWTSNAVSPRRVKVSVSLGSTGVVLLSWTL